MCLLFAFDYGFSVGCRVCLLYVVLIVWIMLCFAIYLMIVCCVLTLLCVFTLVKGWFFDCGLGLILVVRLY